MKTFLYILSALAVTAILGLFVLKQPNGQPWININNLLSKTAPISNKFDTLKKDIKTTFDGITDYKNEQKNSSKIYRWQDNKGNWIYSDKPSSEFSNETVSLGSENIINLSTEPSLKLTTDSKLKSQTQNKELTTVPLPNNINELYKDANNVQVLMNNRANIIADSVKKNTNSQ